MGHQAVELSSVDGEVEVPMRSGLDAGDGVDSPASGDPDAKAPSLESIEEVEDLLGFHGPILFGDRQHPPSPADIRARTTRALSSLSA